MKKIIIAVLVIVAAFLLSWYFYLQSNSKQANVGQKEQMENKEPVEEEIIIDDTQTNNQPENKQNESQMSSSTEPKVKKYLVTYMDSGYSPLTLTIKAGDSVVFENKSTSGMRTSSAMHPSHMAYSGTSLQQHCPDLENDDFDQCKSSQPLESWEFTFNKKGAWKYHNHVKSSHFGQVIVE